MTTLVDVKRATKLRRKAEERYRRTIVAAHRDLEAQGYTNAYTLIARAAGCSRQAARQMVLSQKPATATDSEAL